MPDFTVRIVPQANTTLVTWTDVRCNPVPQRPHQHWRVDTAPWSDQEFRCVVGGVDAPMDAALGGRLFSWWWLALPVYPAPLIIPAFARTSLVTISRLGPALEVGHYELVAYRPSGGAVVFPFEVQV